MPRKALGVMLGIVVVSGVFSGCTVIEEWLCGDPRSWHFYWTQPGAYEDFPPEGNETGYNVWYFNTTTGLQKRAERQTEGQVNLGLYVGKRDRSEFSVAARLATDDPTQDEMRSWLRQTLEDLDLGAPAYSGTPQFEKDLPEC